MSTPQPSDQPQPTSDQPTTDTPNEPARPVEHPAEQPEGDGAER